MEKTFVDTAGFYAVADRSDRHHQAAAALFADRGSQGKLVTSDYVFVESWLLLRARLGRDAAMQFWDAMLGGVVEVLGVTAADVTRGRAIARDWPDQSFSLVDCTSFALMERAGLDHAFTFDAHFRLYRYGENRRRALNVVP